eukprot:356124-Prymnesium_polylepis.1
MGRARRSDCTNRSRSCATSSTLRLVAQQLDAAAASIAPIHTRAPVIASTPAEIAGATQAAAPQREVSTSTNGILYTSRSCKTTFT